VLPSGNHSTRVAGPKRATTRTSATYGASDGASEATCATGNIDATSHRRGPSGKVRFLQSTRERGCQPAVMDLGLADRIVLITGGSQGIGKAAALAFARERARIVITYHSHRDKADEVVAAARLLGTEALAVPMELAARQSIHAAVATAVEHFGRVDVLVNNAVSWGQRLPWNMPRFEELPDEEWRSLLRANLEGPYTAIQAVLPSMRASGWGRIVNVSSGIAVDGMPGAGPYASAKAALHGLTRTLCKELGPAGILVNVVMPGLTLTERNAGRIPPERRAEFERSSPIRRILPPEEVVPTIVFLSSAANTAVTGEIVRASGGIM
jgi:3-oxoacyl-[acyl-carrier protein] reductase